jgi:acyl-CoA synthetase (AMP-forming)/AMP-acid ligase II
MNLSGAITHHARVQPDHPALIQGRRTLTYAMLEREIDATASRLAGAGLGPGDRIGICLKEGPEFLIGLFAVARVWGVVVPLDWRAPEADRRRIAEALRLKLLMCETSTASSISCAIGWSALRSMPSERAAGTTLEEPDGDAPFLIALSSGTTGQPKGSVVSHLGQLLRNVRAQADLRFDPDTRYLSSMPLVHASGRNRCIGCLIGGNTVIMHPPLFRADELVEAAARCDATDLHMVPATARSLLQLDASNGPLFPRVRRLVVSAGPFGAEDRSRALRQLSPNIYISYGASGYSTIALLKPENVATHSESVGRPTFLTEVQIVDDSGQSVPPGNEGRLRCRGPGIASEIIGADATAEEAEFLGDGWYYTGDFGRLSEGGFIYLTGRVSNRIRRSGASIAAEEVERVLCEHPLVLDAAVIGRPSPEMGQAVIAFVVLRSGLDVQELEAHCRRHLARAKVPSEFHIVQSFPRNPVGRVMRRALLESVMPKQAGPNGLDEYR